MAAERTRIDGSQGRDGRRDEWRIGLFEALFLALLAGALALLRWLW